VKGMAKVGPKFASVYLQFLGEMGLTFPELDVSAEKAKKTSFVEFSKAIEPIVKQIAARDASIFNSDKGAQIAPGVVMTKGLWKDAGKATQKAIWDFLSSLVLLASYEEKHAKKNVIDENPIFSKFFDVSGADVDLKKMFTNLGSSFSDQSFTGFFNGFKEAAENLKEKFAEQTGISGEDLPPLPEKLFKGHIARIAEELAREFKPEDFGLSPDMLQSNDTASVFQYLQEIFTKNPEMLMKGAKKIATRIQEKLQKGQVRREDLIAEAEELMEDFKSNPMFSQIFEQLSSSLRGMKGAGGGSTDSTSSRRKDVQERLKKKLEEKRKAAAEKEKK